MSELMPWLYTEQARKKEIQAALGGEVWWERDLMWWRPVGQHRVVVMPYHELVERFDPDEFAASAWAKWAEYGCKL